jgi:hypothetical protein
MNSTSTTDNLNELLQVLEDGKEGFSKAERGEDHAVEAFNKALERELPGDLRQEVKSQADRVLKAHIRVRELRDAAHATS